MQIKLLYQFSGAIFPSFHLSTTKYNSYNCIPKFAKLKGKHLFQICSCLKKRIHSFFCRLQTNTLNCKLLFQFVLYFFVYFSSSLKKIELDSHVRDFSQGFYICYLSPNILPLVSNLFWFHAFNLAHIQVQTLRRFTEGGFKFVEFKNRMLTILRCVQDFTLNKTIMRNN